MHKPGGGRGVGVAAGSELGPLQTSSSEPAISAESQPPAAAATAPENPRHPTITLATSGDSTVDSPPRAAVSTAPAAAPPVSPAPTPTFFLELPGMNSPEFRGHGDLMETAVMLHRTAEKEKAKLRHLFLFESALIISKYKGKKYNVKGTLPLEKALQVKNFAWEALPSDEQPSKSDGAFAVYDATGKLLHAICETSRENRNAKAKITKAMDNQLAVLRGEKSDATTVDMAAEATSFLLNLQTGATGAGAATTATPAAASPAARTPVVEEDGLYDNLQGAGFDEGDFKSLQLENIDLQGKVVELTADLTLSQQTNTDLIAHATKMQKVIKAQMLEIATLKRTLTMQK